MLAERSSVAVLVILVVFAEFCSTAAPRAADGSPYKDKNGYFTFMPPPGWIRKDYPDEPRSKVQFTDPRSGAYVRLIVSVAGPDLTAENFVEDRRESMETIRERFGAQVRSMEGRQGSFRGYPAFFVRMSLNNEASEQTFFLADTLFFNIWYGAPSTSVLDAHRSLITQSLDSIVVRNSGDPAQYEIQRVASKVRLAHLLSVQGDFASARREIDEGLAEFPRNARLKQALRYLEQGQVVPSPLP